MNFIRIILVIIILTILPSLSYPISCENMKNKKFKLEIASVTVADDELLIRFKLFNYGKESIYFISPDPKSSLNNTWPRVPFVKIDQVNVLEISSFIADLPEGRLIEAPYFHPASKLDVGTFDGSISLALPIFANIPYADVQPDKIDFKKIKKVKLVIGVLPCSEVGSVTQNIPSENAVFDYVSGGNIINCHGEKKRIIDFQVLIEDLEIL